MDIQPKVLIVILNYKTYELTLDVIKQIRQIDYPNYDIIVVDNCSPNESGHVLAENAEKEHYIFIQNTSNAGYAAGNNIGIKYAAEQGYSYALIMNNDLKVIDTHFLTTLVSAAEYNHGTACVGPKVYDLDHNITPPFIDRPSFFDLTIGIVARKKRRSKYVEESGEVYRVFGCCMLLNSMMLQKIGYLDERTFLYCEEDILAEKLLDAGYKTRYEKDASILHMVSMTVGEEQKSNNLKKSKVYLQSMDIYLRYYRHYGILRRNACKAVRSLILRFRAPVH